MYHNKNIVIFSDGTGQNGGKGVNTNVYRLFNKAEDRTAHQVTFYDRGAGTGAHRVTGMLGGGGVSRNIKECYRFIFDHYKAGDHLYLFGFSRGAATVRSLSAFIHLFGILPKSRPELINAAYDIYRMADCVKRETRARDFLTQHHTLHAKIRFLGVWDTVAALGVPFKALDDVLDRLPYFKHRFHDFRLSPSVQNAAQALAIDDERAAFHPVLWDQQTHPLQTMEQVWFCGAHSDIGGGYAETGLSDITLQWMADKAAECGLRLFPQELLMPNVNDILHNPRDMWWKRVVYRRKSRFWPVKTHGNPVVHETVFRRKLGADNAPRSVYCPWILKGDQDDRTRYT